jgi:hypothetical protein
MLMEILRNNINQQITVSEDSIFKTDLGWTEGAEVLDKEILISIINPIENYETVRFIHSPYTSVNGIYQTDIWYDFYFLADSTSASTYTQDYRVMDITLDDNYKMLKQSTESFFRLEFYKTPNNDAPTQTNRRLVFAKNLTLPLGEKIFFTGTTVVGGVPLNEYIFFPVFTGSNYRNTENMYLFWFMDETPFNETNITGNTFFMTAKFYNAKDGSIIDFVNKNKLTEVNEEDDLYYKMVIERTDFSYQVFTYSGGTEDRIGVTNNSIKFYERRK